MKKEDPDEFRLVKAVGKIPPEYPDYDDDEDEDECLKHEECSDCPYFCPMCGECRLEDED